MNCRTLMVAINSASHLKLISHYMRHFHDLSTIDCVASRSLFSAVVIRSFSPVHSIDPVRGVSVRTGASTCQLGGRPKIETHTAFSGKHFWRIHNEFTINLICTRFYPTNTKTGKGYSMKMKSAYLLLDCILACLSCFSIEKSVVQYLFRILQVPLKRNISDVKIYYHRSGFHRQQRYFHFTTRNNTSLVEL